MGELDEVLNKGASSFAGVVIDSLKNLEKNIQKLMAMIAPGAEIISYDVGNLRDLNLPVHIKGKFRAKGYATMEDNEIRFRLPSGTIVQFGAMSMFSGLFSKEKRNFPIVFYYPSWRILQEAEITFPAGYEPKLPEPTEVVLPFGSFQAHYTKGDGKLLVKIDVKLQAI